MNEELMKDLEKAFNKHDYFLVKGVYTDVPIFKCKDKVISLIEYKAEDNVHYDSF
jgi:hypothetical protein